MTARQFIAKRLRATRLLIVGMTMLSLVMFLIGCCIEPILVILVLMLALPMALLTVWLVSRERHCPFCAKSLYGIIPPKQGVIRAMRFTPCCGRRMDEEVSAELAIPLVAPERSTPDPATNAARAENALPPPASDALLAAMTKRRWTGMGIIGLAAVFLGVGLALHKLYDPDNYHFGVAFQIPATMALLAAITGIVMVRRSTRGRCPACGGAVRLVRARPAQKGPLVPHTYTHRHCPWCGVNVLPDVA